MLTVIPPVAIGGVVYGRFDISSVIMFRYIKRFSKRQQNALAVSSEVADERISNIRTVRSFAQEAREVIRYDGQSYSLSYL